VHPATGLVATTTLLGPVLLPHELRRTSLQSMRWRTKSAGVYAAKSPAHSYMFKRQRIDNFLQPEGQVGTMTSVMVELP
jgi:hypothetical protein